MKPLGKSDQESFAGVVGARNVRLGNEISQTSRPGISGRDNKIGDRRRYTGRSDSLLKDFDWHRGAREIKEGGVDGDAVANTGE